MSVENETENIQPEDQKENIKKGGNDPKMASDIVMDKKREAKIRVLEEKNASMEDKINSLLESKKANESELLAIRDFMKSKPVEPSAQKTWWDSFNEYIQNLY